MSIAVTNPTSVVITFAPAPVIEDNKAARKVATDDAVRIVNAAIVSFERAARIAAWG